MTLWNLLGAASVYLACALGAVSADAAKSPPPVEFQQDGGAYSWYVWGGASPKLLLSRRESNPPGVPSTIETWNPQAAVLCSGLRSGGLQARFFRPTQRDLQLVLTAAPGVFRVRTGVFIARIDGRPEPMASAPRLIEGRGDLSDEWFDQLGKATTLEFRYGNQVRAFPGPRAALVAHFRQLCSDLHDEGLRDQ